MWNHYREVDLPFNRLDPPTFRFTVRWTLHELLGYVRTWSAVKQAIAALGDEFYRASCDALGEAWGAPSVSRELEMDFCFVATRKPG